MKNLKEDHLIRIDGTVEQGHYRDEEPDHIQLITRGSFVFRDGSYFISYKETETTGYEGCTTTLKIAQDGHRVAMLRFGPKPSQLVIEKGTRHVCHYETGYGALTLGVAADEIHLDLNEKGGKARFSYTLDSGSEELLSRNMVAVTVTPLAGTPS